MNRYPQNVNEYIAPMLLRQVGVVLDDSVMNPSSPLPEESIGATTAGQEVEFYDDDDMFNHDWY